MSSSVSADDTAALHGIRSDSGYASSNRSQGSRRPPVAHSRPSGINGKFDRMTAAMSAVASDGRPLEESGSSRGVTRVSIAPQGDRKSGIRLSGRKRTREDEAEGVEDRWGRRRRMQGVGGAGGSTGSIGDTFELLGRRDASRSEEWAGSETRGMVGVEQEEGSFLEIRHELSPSGSGKKRTSVKDRRVPDVLPRGAQVPSLERPPWMIQPTATKASPPSPPPAWLVRDLSHSTPPVSVYASSRHPSLDPAGRMDVDGYSLVSDPPVEAYPVPIRLPNRPDALPFSTSGRLEPRSLAFDSGSSVPSLYEWQMGQPSDLGGRSSPRQFDNIGPESFSAIGPSFNDRQFANLSLQYDSPNRRLHQAPMKHQGYDLRTSDRYQPYQSTSALLDDARWSGRSVERCEAPLWQERPQDPRDERQRHFDPSYDPVPATYPPLVGIPTLVNHLPPHDTPSNFWRPATRLSIQGNDLRSEHDVYAAKLLRTDDGSDPTPLSLPFQHHLCSSHEPKSKSGEHYRLHSSDLSPSPARMHAPNSPFIPDRSESLSPLHLPPLLRSSSTAQLYPWSKDTRSVDVEGSRAFTDEPPETVHRRSTPQPAFFSSSQTPGASPLHIFDDSTRVQDGIQGETGVSVPPLDSNSGQQETVDGPAAEGEWKYDWDSIVEEDDGMEDVQGERRVEEEERTMSFKIFEDPVVVA